MSQPPRPARPPAATAEYLEDHYNNRARVPGHATIVAGWQCDAAAFRETQATAGRHERVSYGTSDRCTLDLFAPAQDRTPGRAVLFVHGGYWQGLEPSFFSHLAGGLTARGHVVAMAGYDLCPTVPLATIVEELRAACAHLLRLGRRPVVAGHSAGGHLAACMLATDWPAFAPGLPAGLVPAAFAISGLFDLVPLTATSINGALGLDAAEAARLSPLDWTPPAGLTLDAVVGGEEGAEYHLQSRGIAAAWGAAGVATRYAVEEGRDHFTVVAPLADPESAMTRRLSDLVGAATA